MNRRFAQTLRLAAQGAASTRDAGEGRNGETDGSGPPPLRLSLPDLIHMHGESSGAVLLLLMAMLSAVPIAGAGSLLSLGMLALAWHWWRGRDAMLLPQRLGRLTLSAKWTRHCLNSLAWLYEHAAARMRPRWALWSAPRSRPVWATWIALMAVLIFLPLPLGNLLPALSLVLLSLGWMYRDGVVLLLAGLSGLLAMAYAQFLSYLVLGLLQGLGAG